MPRRTQNHAGRWQWPTYPTGRRRPFIPHGAGKGEFRLRPRAGPVGLLELLR
jgi:hypothetical protein